jgi:hypothetical protein
MTENRQNDKGHRRALLKGVAVVLPAVWTTPLAKSVVLPVHAQTSGCAAPEDCYVIEGGSFSWPGGTGPYNVDFRLGSDCSSETSIGAHVVVAASFEEAAALLSCSSGLVATLLPTNPPAPEGCDFWSCDAAATVGP